MGTLKKFLEKMNKWYFEKNGELQTLSLSPMDVSSLTSPDKEVQASVGLVFHSISRHSPDTAGSVMADFIPLVFLAIHTKTTEEGVWI